MSNREIDLALAFLQSQPGAAAAILEQQPIEQVAIFFNGVPHTLAAPVVEKMLPQYAARICKLLDPSVSAGFLSALDTGLVAAIVRYSGEQVGRQLLGLLPEQTKIACRLLLNYPETAVGAWMLSNIGTLPGDCTVEQARDRLVSESGVVDTDSVPVVDRGRLLQGWLRLAKLLGASPETPIIQIMDKTSETLSGRTPLASAQNHSIWSQQDSIAVVNRQHQLVGILRHVDMRKGLAQLSNSVARAPSEDPLAGFAEAYGASLLALFGSLADMRQIGKQPANRL